MAKSRDDPEIGAEPRPAVAGSRALEARMRETMANMAAFGVMMSGRSVPARFRVLEISPPQDYTPSQAPDEPEEPDNIVNHPTRRR